MVQVQAGKATTVCINQMVSITALNDGDRLAIFRIDDQPSIRSAADLMYLLYPGDLLQRCGGLFEAAAVQGIGPCLIRRQLSQLRLDGLTHPCGGILKDNLISADLYRPMGRHKGV
jgi:hypothetical protein